LPMHLCVLRALTTTPTASQTRTAAALHTASAFYYSLLPAAGLAYRHCRAAADDSCHTGFRLLPTQRDMVALSAHSSGTTMFGFSHIPLNSSTDARSTAWQAFAAKTRGLPTAANYLLRTSLPLTAARRTQLFWTFYAIPFLLLPQRCEPLPPRVRDMAHFLACRVAEQNNG